MTARKPPLILIVDDDKLVRTVLKDALGGDYRFAEAADGHHALEVARADPPSAVLLDLFMPNKSGLEVLVELRQAYPATPVLVISSLDSQALVQQAIDRGAAGFIAKPFHPVEIADEVRRALGRS